jgi:hypothetical protein
VDADHRAVLMPEPSRNDLVALAESQQIAVVHPDTVLA